MTENDLSMIVTDKRKEVLEILFFNNEIRTLTSKDIYKETELHLTPPDVSNTIYDLKTMGLAEPGKTQGKYITVNITKEGILALGKKIPSNNPWDRLKEVPFNKPITTTKKVEDFSLKERFTQLENRLDKIESLLKPSSTPLSNIDGKIQVLTDLTFSRYISSEYMQVLKTILEDYKSIKK